MLENLKLKIEKILDKKLKKYKIFYINNKINKNKFYCLSMFPYPSGKLHIGHIRNYTISDIISRYKRQKNYYVFNPIGWDSFGTPAENAARLKNINPDLWTEDNINTMKCQLKELNFCFNWDKEIKTSSVDYYKWEQLFIIKLYKSNLVYKKKAYINWDPVEKTVLSNEQVINGVGWRSNALIERKKIDQWYIKITSYANDLLNDINNLIGWPIKVKEMQKNWIKKLVGYEIILNIKNIKINFKIFLNNLSDFYNLNNIIFFDEHEIIDILKKKKYISVYFLLNPITKKNILINFENQNILNKNNQYELLFLNKINNSNKRYFNSIKKKFLEYFIYRILKKKIFIKIKEFFNIKDWCISRQRYWGTPIPIIHCKNCGFIEDRKKNLPIILPKINKKILNTVSLKNINSFLTTKCYKCNKKCDREKDVFDTFLQSSWYYIKYFFNKYSVNSNYLNVWLPVNQYIGGIEHANLHLIYARFFHKIMYDFKIVKSIEPFDYLLTQGMVLLNGSKMSKSKGNIIDQEKLIKKYGIDALKMFIIFSAPPDQSFEWKENGIVGCKRFLDKLLKFSINIKCISNNILYKLSKIKNNELINEFNDILNKINYNINKKNLFNNVIALTMKLYKKISNIKNINKDNYILLTKILENLIIILSPIAPQITHFIWSYILNKSTYIINEKFPSLILGSNDINKKKFIIQLNGKFKEMLIINNVDSSLNLENIILNNLIKKNFLLNKNIKKIINIKEKIFNIITE